AFPKIYVGCPRWSVKEWVGKLYPKGTKDSNFLEEYRKQFNCVELNSTFYNLYDESAIAKWADKIGDTEFRFCPKVFQGISHEGHLDDKLALTHAFEKSIVAFGNHLGPAFLQLSDGFGPQRNAQLKNYLQAWPSAVPLFVEVRHAGWFQSSVIENLTNLLRLLNKGLIITDTAGRRDVCHMHLTAPRTMIRFVANNLHPTDHSRIDQWVERIQYWLENGLKELYFIIHMDQEKHSPELAEYLIDNLNAACRLKLKKPVIVQQELF
ncbi:MAG: DUF72 domain-containing protein, partial [Chitinophagaceae bacterium]